MSFRLRAAAVIGVLIVAATIAWWLAQRSAGPPPAIATFAGSSACESCHAPEYAAWRQSQHAVAMQDVTDATVLGRFDDVRFSQGAVTSRFFRRDGRFFVHTDGPDGKLADFELKYGFGVYPLQQYLVPLPGGRLQALGIAWDARPAASGGERWFHLYPGGPPKAGDPLHWTGIDQNWNYQCADCHSTNLRKNYDGAAGTFATSWSEISVGCEACHGPGSEHIRWANRGYARRALATTNGLVLALDERRGVAWEPQVAGTARRSAPRDTSREIDACARCHARRGQYSDDIHAGQEWLDAFRPALLEPGLYHPDGQQRDEVYTWGSFVQSRMHAAGVTCADCHDPHTQRLRAPGDAVCAQCHAPAVFDTAAHHHHEAQSPGSRCIACHMPATTYMRIDPRHDHSFRIPRPDRGLTLGTPDACSGCHAERGAQWAAGAIAAWYPQPKPGSQSFAEAFAQADRGDPAAAPALASLIGDTAQPALVRASAVARMARDLSPEHLPVVTRALQDGDALVRASAAEALAGADAGTRAESLARLLVDPVRLVRMNAARALAGEPEGRLLGGERDRFAAALGEWVAAQRFNADRPEAQANLGTLAAERGALDDAIAAYRRALVLDPTFVPAAVNLADIERARGDEAAAERVLREALARNPDAAPVHHTLGLALIRQRRTAEALVELKAAAALDPSQPRYAYVYAVALHDTGDAAASLSLLREAVARHPYDRNLRDALAAYETERRSRSPTDMRP